MTDLATAHRELLAATSDWSTVRDFARAARVWANAVTAHVEETRAIVDEWRHPQADAILASVRGTDA